MGPVSYKAPTGLFSGDIDLDVDTRIKTEPVDSDRPKKTLSAGEFQDKLKAAFLRQQKPKAFPLPHRPQNHSKDITRPVPDVSIKQEPEDDDVDMDFGRVTREMYNGDEMSRREKSDDVRVSTPEFETEGFLLYYQ